MGYLRGTGTGITGTGTGTGRFLCEEITEWGARMVQTNSTPQVRRQPRCAAHVCAVTCQVLIPPPQPPQPRPAPTSAVSNPGTILSGLPVEVPNPNGSDLTSGAGGAGGALASSVVSPSPVCIVEQWGVRGGMRVSFAPRVVVRMFFIFLVFLPKKLPKKPLPKMYVWSTLPERRRLLGRCDVRCPRGGRTAQLGRRGGVYSMV
jgi:hypothetical protein